MTLLLLLSLSLSLLLVVVVVVVVVVIVGVVVVFVVVVVVGVVIVVAVIAVVVVVAVAVFVPVPDNVKSMLREHAGKGKNGQSNNRKAGSQRRDSDHQKQTPKAARGYINRREHKTPNNKTDSVTVNDVRK